VTASLDARIGSGLSRWTGAVQRHAALVLVVAALGTALAGAYTTRHLGINADENALFPADLPFRVGEDRFFATFPVLLNDILIVIDADRAEAARSAAQRLAERLRRSPEIFSSVREVQGEFFDRHAFLYMDMSELDELSDQLARAQPLLAELSRDASLRGLASMLAAGLPAYADGEVEAESLRPMLDGFSDAITALLAGESYELDWAEILAAGDGTEDPRRRILSVQPVLDFSDFVASDRPLSAIRRIARELELVPEHGLRVRVTGDVALSFEEMQLLEGQAMRAGAASFVMVSLLLLLALRRGRPIWATLISLLVGLILTGTFAAVFVGHLNLVSVAFAVLFIGLGVDFGIHLCMRYQELLTSGETRRAALDETARGVGSSLVLCAATTAVGFLAFLPTDFAGVAELGLISGAGILISLLCSFTVLPAILSLGPAPAAPTRRQIDLRLPGFATRHPGSVAAVALAAALASLALLPDVRFDHNPLDVRDPGAESVQAFEDLLASSRTSPWSLNLIASDRRETERLVSELLALPEVAGVTSVFDYVPGDQAEKLALIEDMALLLPPASAHRREPPALADQIAALAKLRAALARLREEVGGSALHASAAGLESSLVEWDSSLAVASDVGASVARLESSLLAGLPDQLVALERGLGAGPVSLETLPSDLLETLVGRGGEIRIEIHPREDLLDPVALERFVRAVRRLGPDATGPATTIYESGRTVVAALRQAFAAALAAIAVLLLLVWRRIVDALLVLAPLLLAGLYTSATAVLVGIPFNFADVIVLPLLLGVGVDSGIHLVHRAHMGDAAGGSLLETSTARAVVFSAATTIASFGSLAFASHRGMASLGQLLTVGVSFTVLCNVVVLPALIELRERRARLTRRARMP
jgi:hopanoid biosynthesis associated RND transporter like protein HpnN